MVSRGNARDNRIRHTSFFTISLVLLVTLTGTSCSNADNLKGKVAVVVNQASDVKALHALEKELSLNQEARSPRPAGIEAVDGATVPAQPAYLIGAGDVLEVVYHFEYKKAMEEYKLAVQDHISVNFLFQQQFSSTAIIRPDGKIALPLIGDVDTTSETPASLSNKLTTLYSKFINYPQITVTLLEFDASVAELKREVTNASRGQSKTVPVAPDGRVSFPIIGSIQAAGLSVPQLEKIIDEKYREKISSLHATLILSEIHNSKCYVLGEVKTPGSYDIIHNGNILNVITQAGGHLPSANLEQVLVYETYGLKKPLIYVVNVENMLDDAEPFDGIVLHPADIIYLPKEPLDRANDTIAKIFTKGLYGILPFQATTGQ